MNYLFKNVKLCGFAISALLLFIALGPIAVEAHQAVDPKILKLIQAAPAGSPSCFGDGGKPTNACIEKGRQLFENGTFNGNGRTCATCHPANNNFTIDVPYINKLPTNDKLFVNEQIAALAELETPLLRKYGLICENLDGFGNNGRDSSRKRNCVMRAVIATEGLNVSTAPDAGPFDTAPTANAFTPNRPTFPLNSALGWGGDGSPGNGSLRNFAIGAVVQHFPKTLNRVAGTDFILPTDDQLEAMVAFQLSLGRQGEMNLNPDPTASNKSFNCKNYETTVDPITNAPKKKFLCNSPTVFELKTIDQIKSWTAELATGATPFSGTLLEFTDNTAATGQLLFFGGMPSRPKSGVPTDIRTCSGCHIQAGAGSPSAVNTPPSNGVGAGNRQRATGASEAANSPICLPEAQGVIYNADGGFGAGADGFPFTKDKKGNYTVPQPCTSNFTTKFIPSGSCFKLFTTDTTQPPLSNDAIVLTPATSASADVGIKNLMPRNSICGGNVTDTVYLTGTGFFSTPSIIEAASTIPLFHNNIAATVEDAVRFYGSETFNASASGNGNRMVFTNDIVSNVSAFLRSINSLDNLKISANYVDAAIAASQSSNSDEKVRNTKLAIKRIADAAAVLAIGGPATSNTLGGPTVLYGSIPQVTQAMQSATDKLTQNGNTDLALSNLTSSDLLTARNKISNACKAMLKYDSANSFCP